MKEGQDIMEAGPADEAAFARRNYGLIADIPVRLSVEVGSTALKLSELMDLAEGSVVELDRQSHELLDIMANGTLIAKGEVVTVNGRFGIRVVEVVAEGGIAGASGANNDDLHPEAAGPDPAGRRDGVRRALAVAQGPAGHGAGQRERLVNLVDAVPLGATGRLAVVDFAGKRLLLAVTRTGGVQLLSEGPAPAAVRRRPMPEVLKRLLIAAIPLLFLCWSPRPTWRRPRLRPQAPAAQAAPALRPPPPPAPAATGGQPGALDRALGTFAGDGRPLSLSLQILLLMSLLTVLPSLLLMMTSFTRIIIVLSILRQALGLQQTPPNQVLVGLSLFLWLFVMAPVIDRDQPERLHALWRRPDQHRGGGRRAPARCCTAS